MKVVNCRIKINAVSFLLWAVIQMTKKKALKYCDHKRKGGKNKEGCSEEITLIKNRRLARKTKEEDKHFRLKDELLWWLSGVREQRPFGKIPSSSFIQTSRHWKQPSDKMDLE